ncbi:MAG: hypothetical protein LUG93_10110 [Lachnospiraceae bacterium]|nr:hypothetical protein [Lachnospiraceae bacterium]
MLTAEYQASVGTMQLLTGKLAFHNLFRIDFMRDTDRTIAAAIQHGAVRNAGKRHTETEGTSIDYEMICTGGAAGVTKDKNGLEGTEEKAAIVTEVHVESEAGAGRKQEKHPGDPYDDVYRTLLNDCPQLLIPLVNEIFHEEFTKDDKVVFSKDIHMTKGQEGEPSKRMTDSSFEIVGIVRKKYLIEEQTRPDTSILNRLFEYAMLVARSSGVNKDNVLKVEFPNCAVLFLRSTKYTPDKMQIEIKAPLGEVLVDVLVMKLKDYTLDDMISRELLILFPFYLFRFSERTLKKCNQDEEQLEMIRSDYRRMQEHMTQLADKGDLNEFYRHTIIYLCNVVVENLARRYRKVVKGVQSVMGGQVIETDAKKILNQGRQEERVNTERERRRAEAAEQRATVAEQKANAAEQKATVAEQKVSMLQKELDALRQEFSELMRAQGPKLAKQ